MSAFDKSDPAVRATYDRPLLRVRRIGPVVTEEKKTSIHLKCGRRVRGRASLKSRLDLNIVSAAPIADSRVVKRDQVSASRYHNTVPLSSPRDVDAQLVAWLTAAYELVS